MLKYLLEYEFLSYLLEDDMVVNTDKKKKLEIKKDKDTGEKLIDKQSIPLDAQIRAMCKELYRATIESGRFQSKMNDTISQMQQAGAGEAEIGQIQQVMQDQMMGAQTRAMDLEMNVMGMAGQNMQLSMLAQKLSGEAKMLANKANKEYFDKKTEKAKKDIAKMLQQKQAEAAKKQAEGGKHEQSEK